MNITPKDYPVMDGFALNTNLKCNLTFLNLAVSEAFDRLRRSGAYRSKQWCVPKDSTESIPARDSFQYELNCVPGSAIWGFIFAVADTNANIGPFSLQIREACTGVPLLSEPVRADQFAQSFAKQQLLSDLLIIPTPGLVVVEICSQQSTNASQVQLILCGGEPVCL